MDLTESKKAVFIQKWIRGYLARKTLIGLNKEYAKALERKAEKESELGLFHSYTINDHYFAYFQQETKNEFPTNSLIKNSLSAIILTVDEHKILILPRVCIQTIKISMEKHSAVHKKNQDILIISEKPDKRKENDIENLEIEGFHNLSQKKIISIIMYEAETKPNCQISVIFTSKFRQKLLDNLSTDIVNANSKPPVNLRRDYDKDKPALRYFSQKEIIRVVPAKLSLKPLAHSKDGSNKNNFDVKDPNYTVRKSNRMHKSNISKKNSSLTNNQPGKIKQQSNPYDLKYARQQLLDFFNIKIVVDSNKRFPKIRLVKIKKREKNVKKQ